MTLEIGDVFLIRDLHYTGYDPHYQIVVHKTASSLLVLVYPTTKIEKAKKACIRDGSSLAGGGLPSTYVEIPMGSCPALPRLCAVDCNKAFVKSESDCIGGFDFKSREGKLDMSLIRRIREGISVSIVVEPRVIHALDE